MSKDDDEYWEPYLEVLAQWYRLCERFVGEATDTWSGMIDNIEIWQAVEESSPHSLSYILHKTRKFKYDAIRLLWNQEIDSYPELMFFNYMTTEEATLLENFNPEGRDYEGEILPFSSLGYPTLSTVKEVFDPRWLPSGEPYVFDLYSAESYKPPASAVANAKRGLKLRKEWGRGGLSPSEAKSQGIDSGVTRARKISSGKVSRHDVRRMSAFNRHRKNYRPEKKMPDGGPTAGTIAWLLWGGTSGVNWAKKKSAAMNAETFGAESFEDFKRKMVGDEVVAGDLGYMEALEEFYEEYLEDFERITDEFCPEPETFEEFQERVLKNDYEYEMSLDAEDWSGEDEEELKQYMVIVPALHYYSIGPVEASDEEEAVDDVRNNWRSHWRHTIDDNGDWGGPLWRYSRLSSHDPEAYEVFGSESWGGDPDGPLAKALAKARESLKKPQKPLQITRLPDPNQKTLKDFEADWQDLPRNELGQWQKPVSTEQLQNLIATTPGVPKLSDLLMLYGGDTPNNRYRLYNDMLTLRITTEDFDDDTIVIDIDNDPEIYYQYILEEPLDVEEEDDKLTPEYWDRYSRYLAMTNTPDELEARIESLVSNLDLFNDSDFSEIGVMMAALRQQKFMEKYQAE